MSTWKCKAAAWLRRLADWLVPLEGIAITVPRGALLDAAIVAIAQADTMDAGGEAKRHRVYAALIKAFPNSAKREIARAIEAALLSGEP